MMDTDRITPTISNEEVERLVDRALRNGLVHRLVRLLHRLLARVGCGCTTCEWNKLQVRRIHEALGMAQEEFRRLAIDYHKLKSERDQLKANPKLTGSKSPVE